VGGISRRLQPPIGSSSVYRGSLSLLGAGRGVATAAIILRHFTCSEGANPGRFDYGRVFSNLIRPSAWGFHIETGRKAEEIGIVLGMIEAGREELYRFTSKRNEIESLKKIFRTMVRAARQA
jgi:hypothetical protein